MLTHTRCDPAAPADRDVLTLTQQDFTRLPQQLLLELLLSVALCLLGAQGMGAYEAATGKARLDSISCTSPCSTITPCFDSIPIDTPLHVCCCHPGGYLVSGSMKPIVLSKGAP